MSTEKETDGLSHPHTVQDLIDQLNQVKDKSLPIAVYVVSDQFCEGERTRIIHVDDMCEGVIDLNI